MSNPLDQLLALEAHTQTGTATPRPWAVGATLELGDERWIYDDNGSIVAAVWPHGENEPSPSREANAALIVRAVNSHEALVEAARLAAMMLAVEARCHRDNGEPDKAKPVEGVVDKIRAALAKATEG